MSLSWAEDRGEVISIVCCLLILSFSYRVSDKETIGFFLLQVAM
jgi:hypothetical protein